MQYLVIRKGSDWLVFEADRPVAKTKAKDEALAMAEIAAFAVKAAGGRANVMIEGEDGSLEPYDLDMTWRRPGSSVEKPSL